MTVVPTFKALGKLGAIAIIRTFLNYLLNKELTVKFEMQSRIDEDETQFSYSDEQGRY